jgi:hypothetical protein
VTVESYGIDGELQRSGTGFFVSKDGAIATNQHIVENAIKIVVRHGDGIRSPARSVSLAEKGIDVALIWIDVEQPSYLALDNDAPKVGAETTVIGNPLGFDKSLSTGSVMAVRQFPTGYFGSEISVLQISAPISPGSSGSPVIDSAGSVVGIASFYMLDGQNLNFAIASQHIDELLGNQGARLAASSFYDASGKAIQAAEGTPLPGAADDEITLKQAREIVLSRKQEASYRYELAKRFEIGFPAKFESPDAENHSVDVWLLGAVSVLRSKPTGDPVLDFDVGAGNPFLDDSWRSVSFDSSKHDRSARVSFFLKNTSSRAIEAYKCSYRIVDPFGSAVGRGSLRIVQSIKSQETIVIDEVMQEGDHELLNQSDCHSFKPVISKIEIVYRDTD